MSRLTGCTILLRVAQTALLIAGLFLAYFGWALDHVDEGAWPATLFAADYLRVIAGYNQMRGSGSELTPLDPAFADLVSILEERIPDLPSPISREANIVVETYKYWSVRTDGYSGPALDLLVALENGNPAKLSVMDLESTIRQKYLDRPIFGRTTIYFALGLGLAFAGGVLGIWKPM